MKVCNEFVKEHPDKKDCFEISLDTPVEKGKQFSIICPKGNKEKFLRIKVDNCFLKEIDNQTKKCDYCFIRCANSDYYFVELKGVDIEQAVEQIKVTIFIFREKYNVTKDKTYGYIASSGVPKADLKFQKLQTKFIKEKIGVELKKQTNHYKIIFFYKYNGYHLFY